jgi:hypothetical protein
MFIMLKTFGLFSNETKSATNNLHSVLPYGFYLFSYETNIWSCHFIAESLTLKLRIKHKKCSYDGTIGDSLQPCKCYVMLCLFPCVYKEILLHSCLIMLMICIVSFSKHIVSFQPCDSFVEICNSTLLDLYS